MSGQLETFYINSQHLPASSTKSATTRVSMYDSEMSYQFATMHYRPTYGDFSTFQECAARAAVADLVQNLQSDTGCEYSVEQAEWKAHAWNEGRLQVKLRRGKSMAPHAQ